MPRRFIGASSQWAALRRKPLETARREQSDGGREDLLPLADRDRPAINKTALLVEGEDEHLAGVAGVARGVNCLDPRREMLVVLRRRSEEYRRVHIKSIVIESLDSASGALALSCAGPQHSSLPCASAQLGTNAASAAATIGDLITPSLRLIGLSKIRAKALRYARASRCYARAPPWNGARFGFGYD